MATMAAGINGLGFPDEDIHMRRDSFARKVCGSGSFFHSVAVGNAPANPWRGCSTFVLTGLESLFFTKTIRCMGF